MRGTLGGARCCAPDSISRPAFTLATRRILSIEEILWHPSSRSSLSRGSRNSALTASWVKLPAPRSDSWYGLGSACPHSNTLLCQYISRACCETSTPSYVLITLQSVSMKAKGRITRRYVETGLMQDWGKAKACQWANPGRWVEVPISHPANHLHQQHDGGR